MKVSIDGLADAITQVLTEYGDQCVVASKRAVEKTAEECRKDIMNGATVFKGTKYAKSWRKKLVFSSADETRYTIYSTRYQLAHLLEYGHAKWIYGYYTGGRVEGKPHIRPAEERAEQNLIRELKKEL